MIFPQLSAAVSQRRSPILLPKTEQNDQFLLKVSLWRGFQPNSGMQTAT